MRRELQDLIEECDAELDDIEKRMDGLGMDKMKRYLTDYALIKACGTLEYVYRSIVADYFDQSSLPQIHTYIDKTVREGSMSASYDKMSGLLKKFDDEWAKTFKREVDSSPQSKKLISASNSLVGNRHMFAHGKSHSATFSDIRNYYSDTKKLVFILDSVVNRDCEKP